MGCVRVIFILAACVLEGNRNKNDSRREIEVLLLHSVLSKVISFFIFIVKSSFSLLEGEGALQQVGGQVVHLPQVAAVHVGIQLHVGVGWVGEAG